MENSCQYTLPHPQLLEFLFAFKSKVSMVFRDVLGLHEIDHISIARLSTCHELVVFSSTPAMEFNLFSGPLWRYDRTYDPNWFTLNTQDYWQSLYNTDRYDELYYIKQIKHKYPLGISLAGTIGENQVIYSLASCSSNANAQELFASQQEDMYKIGLYCSQLLDPLFQHCEALGSQNIPSIG